MSESIGNKIKQLREQNSLSLEELAAQTSIHQSIIELIEKDEMAPSIATLVKISRALGTRLGTILDGTEHVGPVIKRSKNIEPSLRITNGSTAARSHMHFFSLAEEKADRNMEPFFMTVGYTPIESQSMSHHEGEEFVYVLQGTMELRYGTEKHILNTGDSVYYDSIVPHCMSSLKEGEQATGIAITYTPF